MGKDIEYIVSNIKMQLSLDHVDEVILPVTSDRLDSIANGLINKGCSVRARSIAQGVNDIPLGLFGAFKYELLISKKEE